MTRLLFSVGTFLVTLSLLRLISGLAGRLDWAILAIGLVVVAMATRGPWDSASSGRNRSVMGFRARSGSDAGEDL
ncbi:hypothetical protein D6T64_07950 [Cryobacterium melibiosiphilum]|uniref:Uncharacterized protein n=1 Tax=Cryobacterium melibiosiphilum TaxID=995039 RepID=A0A3A5MQD2_9MICO|nr:hypothetical protein D6T64_07950 [Cryobacterium melibiosiphilum]